MHKLTSGLTMIEAKKINTGIRNLLSSLCLGCTMLLFSHLALANKTTQYVDITINLTLIAMPQCVVNNNQPIEVNFGDEVITTRIDGGGYRQSVNYNLECETYKSKLAMIRIEGNTASFDYDLLATSKGDLGVQFQVNGSPFPLNEWTDLYYPNKPVLQAVLVKKTGATLKGGVFTAGATMRVEYQ